MKCLISLIKRFLFYRWMYPYIIQTVYFNFHYLPLRQAIHLPILLRKPNFKKLKGKVVVKGQVKFGMIELGRQHVSIYPDSGIMIENDGSIIFNGRCVLGGGAKMSVHGILSFGENFVSSAEMKIACAESISFGSNVLIGWDCLFTDSNFHLLSTITNDLVGKKNIPIKIGDDVWFGLKNVCLPGTRIPSKCVVAANSLVKKSYDIPSYSFLAGAPAEVKNTGVWRNPQND